MIVVVVNHLRLWAEEVPGFAVGVVEAGLGVAAAAEQEAGDSAGGAERDDVPGVFGDDVGGEEVDFAGQVGDGASVGAAVGVDAVESGGELGGAFDLDAPERWRRVRRVGGDGDIWLRGPGFASFFARFFGCFFAFFFSAAAGRSRATDKSVRPTLARPI